MTSEPSVPRNAKEALDQFRRDCWIPQVKPGEGDVASSRFGGRPALRPGEKWPTCGACREKMQLFVQIDLAAAPRPDSTPEALRSGLLQLLYCCNENCDAVGDNFFALKALARIIPACDIGSLHVGDDGQVFPAKQISKWVAAPDFPNYDEAISLGIEFSEDELDEYYSNESDLGNAMPLQCDKLDGWPDWVQGVSYPFCSVCEKQMNYLFQMASNDNVPYMFGDCGIGHVCVCPDHPDRLSFLWDCC